MKIETIQPEAVLPAEMIEVMQDRLVRLERSAKTLKLFVVAVSAALIALVLSGASGDTGEPGVVDVVRAHAVEIVDADNAVRASLDFSDQTGPSLALFDGAGTVRARFFIFEDQIPRLIFCDPEGRTRELLGVSSDGSAVKLFDPDGNMRAIFGLYMDGSGGMALMDSGGGLRLGAAADGDGNPSIDLIDGGGNSIFNIP
jgi:hypothetical protein